MNRRRKFLIAVGSLLCLAILVPVIHHYQLRFAVEKYIAELKAKGEPMDLAQVIPPPAPPEQNSAPLFLKAASLLDTNWNVLGSNPPPAMRMVAPGKAMISWLRPDIRTQEGTNSWAEMEGALADDSEALRLLSQIPDQPTFDFNLDYTAGPEMRLLHLPALKRSAQKLSAQAMDDLHHGDTTSAAKNISTMLALVNGASHDHIIISELVRMAIAQIAIPVTWEFLQSTNLTEEQLARLQDDWSRLEFIKALQHALPMEREGSVKNFAKWRDSNSELQRFIDLQTNVRKVMGTSDDEDSIWDKAKTKANIFFWRYWWSYPDELRYLKGYEVLVSAVQSVETNGSFETAFEQQNAALDQLKISKLHDSFGSLFTSQADFHSMMSESIVTLGVVVRKVMRVEIAKQTVMTAIALKRYQLKHGNYPSDLNSLVPEFVSAVPLDPIDGQPLRYRPNADGTFLLYSVGENGVDDGGDSSLEKGVESSNFYWQNPRALDWVWPQPATPEEVEHFYEHSPK